MSRTRTLTYRGRTYFVESVEGRGDELLPVQFILRAPGGTSYALIATADHPELCFAVSTRGFLRRTPFDAILFRIEDDRLVVIDPDE
jgi:hypothetical protein